MSGLIVPGAGAAVDLSGLGVSEEFRAKHQHIWTITALFGVTSDQMEKLQAEVEETGQQTPIDCGSENLIVMEGPGCFKCRLNWSFGELPDKPGFGGYGYMCVLSDDEVGGGDTGSTEEPV